MKDTEPGETGPPRSSRRIANARWSTLLLVTAFGVAGLLAWPVAADPAPEVEQAVNAARGHCGPLRDDPRVAQAAEIVNRSTFKYLNHTAENVPADDPHPTAILKDLGVQGSKAYSLLGAGHSEDVALKSALLEGYKVLSDCGYTDVGTSVLREDESGYVLVAAVLVGP